MCLLGVDLANDELPGSALNEEEDSPDSADSAFAYFNSADNKRGPTESGGSGRKDGRHLTSRRHGKKKPGALLNVLVGLGERFAEAQLKQQRKRYERNCQRIRSVFDQLSNESGNAGTSV